MKRSMWFAAIVGVAVTSLVPMADAQLDSSDETREVRTFRFEDPWEVSCRSTEGRRASSPVIVCTVPFESERVRVDAPPASTVDVTATLTLDYRTSPRDSGLVQMFVRSGDAEDFVSIPPGRFQIASADNILTTTSITWALSDVDGAGTPYRFYWTIKGDDGVNFAVRGRKMTFEAEITAAS